MRVPTKSSLVFAAGVAVVLAVTGDASSADDRIRLGEVSVPESAAPPGVDSQSLRSAGETEIREIDASKLPKTKKFVVSLAVARTADQPSVAVSVSATLRDGKSGTMLAIIEGKARADGDANPTLRKAVMRAAVKSAVSQIPVAISASH